MVASAVSGDSRRVLRHHGVRRLAAVTVLVAGSMLAAASPAASQGIVVSSERPLARGWQIDALQAVPAPSVVHIPSQPNEDQTVSYLVQPGDTLSGIASKLNVDQRELAAQNGLDQPDQIRVGQRLVMEPKTGQAAVQGRVGVTIPSGLGLRRLQLFPWPPAQGQTVSVWWRTSVPLSLTFQSTSPQADYPTVVEGTEGWGLFPVPSLAPAGPGQIIFVSDGVTGTLPFLISAGDFPSGDVPASASDPILSEPEKVRAEAQRLQTIFARETPNGWTPSSRFRDPLGVAAEHTSPFGTRRTYGNSAAVSAHEGEDYAVAAGTPVLAPAAGTVVLAEPLFVRGNAVVIDHGHGVLTGYWHMQKLDVAEGDWVDTGQRLGEVGSTGLSTGPHLHWELHVHGVAVNPLQWLGR